MKYPSGLLGKIYMTSCDMRKVVMQTVEPVSAKEATDGLVKTLTSTYAEVDIEQTSYKTTQLDT